MSTHFGVVVIRLSGRLGVMELDSFHRQVQDLIRDGQNRIVVDLSEVEYLGAAGIDTLVRCLSEVVRGDGELKLAALSPRAEALLEMTRAKRFFEIFPTVEAAIESYDFVPSAYDFAEPWNAYLALTQEHGHSTTRA